MLLAPAVVAHHLIFNFNSKGLAMDYQFTYYLGATIAKCSMEHEAFANWVNIEVRSNPQLISQALQAIQRLRANKNENDEVKLIGCEYSVFINRDEVMVKANNLLIETDDTLDNDFHYYNLESIAFCGLEDFEQFLVSYQNF